MAKARKVAHIIRHTAARQKELREEFPVEQAPGGTTWESFFGADLANFSEEERENMRALFDSAGQFYSAICNGWPARWFTALGSTGIGKTWLCDKLWTRIRHRFNSSSDYYHRKISWPAFEERLHRKPADPAAVAEFRDMQKWAVLYLDDIYGGPDPWGDKTYDIFTLLDRRIGKWTVITSNKSIEEVQAHDPRIADRMIRAKEGNTVWDGTGIRSWSFLKRLEEMEKKT